MHDVSSIPDPPLKPPSVQRVRAHYASLCKAAIAQTGTASLAGCLLLIDSLDREGDALLIAASIAGAASLVFETRPEMVRHSVRHGIVDFAVNSLDEALRILKNEIRKRQPIGVLLEREPTAALAEMVDRGAQPGFVRGDSQNAAAQSYVETLKQRGARPLPLPGATPDPVWDVCWRANEGGSAVLRQLDLLASQILPEDDLERQNWIARAPRYLPRALRLERCVAMSEQESRAFLAAVQGRGDQKALAAPVIVLVGGQNYSVTG